MLQSHEIAATAGFLVRSQLPNGLIPWFEGGPIDPWNHLEAAMGLAIGGRADEAIEALGALVRLQNADGSFCHYYLANGVKEPNRDTNVTSYIAVGLLGVMAYVRGFESEELFASVLAALDYVVALQRRDGSIPMMCRADGTIYERSLLAGSCSILNALEAGRVLAGVYECERPEWKIAELSLGEYLAGARMGVLDKSDWAMDWYYPALCGLARHEPQRASIASLGEGAGRFLSPGLGVRCIASRPWYTAAETAEAAMAFSIVGDPEVARQALGATRRFRREDGSYYTGLVDPGDVSYPGGEASTYTAAAVLIANEIADGPASFSLADHFARRLEAQRSSTAPRTHNSK